MRSLGTMLSTSVQADRHGPSITTRSPEARTRSNSWRNGVTGPPGLARMRTSACAGRNARADSITAASKAVFRTAVRMLRVPLHDHGMEYGIINGTLSDKVPSLGGAGNTGFGESGHAAMAGQRRAQQQDRNAGARGFAEPHMKIE